MLMCVEEITIAYEMGNKMNFGFWGKRTAKFKFGITHFMLEEEKVYYWFTFL